MIQAAQIEFKKTAGHRPNHKRLLYSDGTLFIELRYHPGDEAMEEEDGKVCQMRVALSPMAQYSKV